MCGHWLSMHWTSTGGFCTADRCMNVCNEFRPDARPSPGERPVFGVHHLPADEAWTPEPLSEYWNQDDRWKP